MYHNYIQELNIHPDEVIMYLRKSRADDPMLSVEEVVQNHEKILDEWAERYLGGKVPEESKFREVVSGETLSERPEVLKVLRLIESPKWRALLIADVARLSRGDLETAGRLINLLRYTNTLVITPYKIYNLQDEDDRSAFERQLKSGSEYLEYQKKIMKRGTDLACKMGFYVFSIPPYGYEKVPVMDGKRKRFTLNPLDDQAPVIYMAFDLFCNKDVGIYNICHHFDSLGFKPPRGQHWSPPALRNMLQNPHYIGKTYNNNRTGVTIVQDGEIKKKRPRKKADQYELYEGRHPAIVPEEWFWKAQKKLGRNTRKKASAKLVNPLAGLVSCQCGSAMTFRTYRYRDAQPRLICINQTHCHTGSCTYAELEGMVVDTLKQSINDFEVIVKNSNEDAVKMHEKLIKSYEKKMQDLEAKELAQWEAQANPDPAQRMPAHIFKALNEKVLREKEQLKETICNARKAMPNPAEYKEKLVRFTDALEALLDPETEVKKKNSLLKACIDKIIYHRDAPERIKKPDRPDRAKNKKITVNGKRVYVPVEDPLTELWTNPPIVIDVKLRV